MVKSPKLLIVASLLTIVVQLDGVSVNPSLCPTNKIAPHRRAVSWTARGEPRTLGLFNSLLTPSRPRPPYVNDHSDLQEQPQEDDPNDCGDIEDYDETDLSSITPGAQNHNNYNEKEFGHTTSSHSGRIWPWFHYRPEPTKKPQRQTPYPSVRPPFSSGGIYESHVYRPPSHHNPSNYIKPVNEYNHDRLQDVYSPSVVGGKPEQVVGYPVRPITSNGNVQRRPSKSIRFPDSASYSNRPTRDKPPYVTASVIGSFIDLLFN